MNTNQQPRPTRPVRMGIAAGLTSHFSISKKLCLRHPFTININGQPVNKRIQTWIDESADLIFDQVYNEGKLSLARDSYDYLMEVLQTRHFSLYAQIQFRKEKRQAQRRLRRMIAAETT